MGRSQFVLLVIKVRLFARILGVLLIIGGVAYLTSGVTAIAWLEYGSIVPGS